MSAGTSRYGAAARRYELDKVDTAPDGFRHRTLFAASAALGELVAGGEVDEDSTQAELEAAGRLLGLAEADVRRQVCNGLRRGRRHPRRAPEGGRCLVDAERVEVLDQLVAWWQRVSAAEWPAQAGSTRLRILAGLFLLAVHAGKVDLDDSLRQVSEASGVSHATVWRHRSALAPWVRLVSTGRRSGGRHRWRLCLTAGASASAQNETSQHPRQGDASGLFQSARLPEREALSDPAHDLWGRWSGGWRLFRLLDDEEGATTAALADVTGYAVGTIRRSLARLAGLGLAQRDGDREWRSVPSASPPEEDVGDFAARRKARHKRQREHFRRHKAATAAAREAAALGRGSPSFAVDVETGEITDVAPGAPGRPSSTLRGDDAVTRPPDTAADQHRTPGRRTGNPTATPASGGRSSERSWAP